MKYKSPEEIDNKIYQWHKSDSDLEVYEYLGITKEEYFKFVEDESSIEYTEVKSQ